MIYYLLFNSFYFSYFLFINIIIINLQKKNIYYILPLIIIIL